MDHSQLNELERRVDEVLFYIWDPLGFKAEPFIRSEYSAYVGEVLDGLKEDKSSKEIEELLIDIVENRMRLEFSQEISTTVARLLVRHKKAIDADES